MEQGQQNETKRSNFFKYHYKGVLICLIPLIGTPLLLVGSTYVGRYLFATFCIYLYFMLNVMPVGAVAFLYIVLMPPLGIMPSNQICTSYYGDQIYEYFGATLIALMMDVSKLNTRLGYLLVDIFGTNIRKMQIGLMATACILSIYLPSTFVAAILMKMTQTALQELYDHGVFNIYSAEETYELNAKSYPSVPVMGIYFTICYAATLGSMCSATQTPNLELTAHYERYMPNASPPSNAAYLIVMGPTMILTLIALFLWIQIVFLALMRPTSAIGEELRMVNNSGDYMAYILSEKKAQLGSWILHTKIAAVVVILSFILVITRRPMAFMGWYDLITTKENGSSVALMGIVILMFILPANILFIKYCICVAPTTEGTTPSLLNWKVVNSNFVWGHLYYLGSGFGAVFAGEESGFYAYMMSKFKSSFENGYQKATLQLYALNFGTFTTILSPADPLIRNVAPILFRTGHAIGLGGGTLAIPFAMGLHNSFLFPCSTPANAVVAGWGNIRTWQFFLTGMVPTLATYLFTFIFTKILGLTAFPNYDGMQNSFNLTADTTTKHK